MNKLPYTKNELFTSNQQREFAGDAAEAAFPVGGIGTGNISVGARGELRDWEIFNSPGKGNYLPYSFFSIWVKKKGARPVTRVLESKLQPPYEKSHGFNSGEVAGLPRLDNTTMKGEYPFVWIKYSDEKLPAEVTLEAFNPFIPLDADNSGIPAAVIRYKVKNVTEEPLEVSIVGSLTNAVGFDGYDEFNNIKLSGKGINKYRQNGNIQGLFYTASDISTDDLKYGNLSFMTSDSNITYKTKWLEGGWFDGIQDFWDDFNEDGKLEKESYYEAPGNKIMDQKLKVGSLGSRKKIAPGEEKTFEFILSWYFPNRKKGWDDDSCSYTNNEQQLMKNYYSTLFKDSWDAGKYLFNNMEELENYTRSFHEAFFSSTLPGYVLDAIASNMVVIRSTTCFRIEDGTFFGWEGSHNQKGCCPGSCTHVWNYAQSLAYLFPELEQSMRSVEFNYETKCTGEMNFRVINVFQDQKWNNKLFFDLPSAADGQLGTIIRVYREWKISGNNDFLKNIWDKVKKALDYAFDQWDKDGDFVLDGKQHVTYDIEFYGENSLTGSIFYAALKAGHEMALFMGDSERAARYNTAFVKGSRKMDRLLWNGEYYFQNLEDVNKYRYQYGKGCLSDQLFGQFLAHIVGLGYVLPEEHVQDAVKSIYRYNFRRDFSEHVNVQRTYVLNEEKGLVLCSWPDGGRPKLPFVYSDEVWTGVEYEVATLLIYEGFIEKGLTLVKATRERHDGYKRNPWNEVECGNHYVRSMSSWALLNALSGYSCDLIKGEMKFAPKINRQGFSSFWSNGRAWGVYKQTIDPQTGEKERGVKVLYGNIEGINIVND